MEDFIIKSILQRDDLIFASIKDLTLLYERYHTRLDNVRNDNEYKLMYSELEKVAICIYYKNNGKIQGKKLSLNIIDNEEYCKNWERQTIEHFVYKYEEQMSTRLRHILIWATRDGGHNYIDELVGINCKNFLYCRNAGDKTYEELVNLVALDKNE
jgi:hypothetical protein